MTMQEAIKKYLEAEADKDALFKGKYKEEYLTKCTVYITECARKELKGTSGAIEDEVVYRWARDFFNDELWQKDKSEKIEKIKTSSPAPAPKKEDKNECDCDEKQETAKSDEAKKEVIIEEKKIVKSKKEKTETDKDDPRQLTMFEIFES